MDKRRYQIDWSLNGRNMKNMGRSVGLTHIAKINNTLAENRFGVALT